MDYSKIVETAKNIFEILAVLAGGAWTYLNYFRGRTYRPRLEPSVTASIESNSTGWFLRILIQVKNVGLSKVEIGRPGTFVLVYEAVPQTSPPKSVVKLQWNEKYLAFDAFLSQERIEPGESIGEPLILFLPAKPSGFKIVLKIRVQEIWWTAETIVQV